MTSSAKRRLAALSEQLVAPIGDQGTFENISILKKIAPDSNGPRVQGKVVIVTGWSLQLFQHTTYLTQATGTNSPLGIGRASAHQFAQNGARAVYLCDFNDSNLETHKRELASLYPSVEVHVRQFDAADEPSVKAVVDDAVTRYGRLDIFFANAGIVGQSKIFTEITADEFLHTLKTNVVR
jgi:NAD(P)-dependent dehydrogenase (short-subunit alcohol dehydrogenase family)